MHCIIVEDIYSAQHSLHFLTNWVCTLAQLCSRVLHLSSDCSRWWFCSNNSLTYVFFMCLHYPIYAEKLCPFMTPVCLSGTVLVVWQFWLWYDGLISTTKSCKQNVEYTEKVTLITLKQNASVDYFTQSFRSKNPEIFIRLNFWILTPNVFVCVSTI